MTILGSLGSVVVTMAAFAIVETFAPLFPMRTLHRAHLRANLALSASTLAINLGLGASAALGSEWLRGRGIGLLATRESTVLLFAAGIVALDLATYWAHWLMHRVPALWRVHRVHHADPLVDVTTSFRQHPFETLLRYAFVLATSWMLGLPVAVVALYRALSALNALAEHANIAIWPRLDSIVSLVMVTPNMHKVHHSRAQRETDTNYGNLLSAFDRILGTFTPTNRGPKVIYGLAGHDEAEQQRLGALLLLPFVH